MVNELDCRGLLCPLPIVQLRKLIGELPQGAQIVMRVSTAQTVANVTHFMATYFGVKVHFDPEGDTFVATFDNPGAGTVPTEVAEGYACDTTQPAPSAGLGADSVILCATDVLGQGDDTLGQVLMKGFLSTLPEWEQLPRAILLMNGGVRLTDDRTGAVSTLQGLVEKGVEILVCGTCVEFFGMAGHVAVGRVTNMYEISLTLARASRVVRL